MVDEVEPVVGSVPGAKPGDGGQVPLTPVAGSDHIAALGYDETTSTLAVMFLDGEVYQYAAVPMATYVEMLTAPSVGRFFFKNVRSRFRYKQVAAAPDA